MGSALADPYLGASIGSNLSCSEQRSPARRPQQGTAVSRRVASPVKRKAGHLGRPLVATQVLCVALSLGVWADNVSICRFISTGQLLQSLCAKLERLLSEESHQDPQRYADQLRVVGGCTHSRLWSGPHGQDFRPV